MRVARMAFSPAVLMSQGGIPLDLIRQMLNFLPDDTKLMGCGFDGAQCLHYMFFTSDMFKDIDQFQSCTDIVPHYIRNPDGTNSCTHIDFRDAKDPDVSCPHSWVTVVGFSNTYEYCKLCNVEKT